MFLTYHQIETDFSRHVYAVTVDTLRKHLAAFRAYASESRSGAESGITFDDGHISNYD
jgi:hypothetical protein